MKKVIGFALAGLLVLDYTAVSLWRLTVESRPVVHTALVTRESSSAAGLQVYPAALGAPYVQAEQDRVKNELMPVIMSVGLQEIYVLAGTRLYKFDRDLNVLRVQNLDDEAGTCSGACD